MGMLPVYFTTTNTTKRKKVKYASSQAKILSQELTKSWDNIVNKHVTNVAPKQQKRKAYEPPKALRRETTYYPSLNSNEGSTALPPAKVYTGDKMIGVATMHKSNSVPVFNQDAAKEISSMRR
jgi:hypothetical protein